MERKLSDKILVSCRIPLYIRTYATKNNLSISQLVMKGFDSYRETDEKHALERLEYHEKRVLHWKHIVLQRDNECNTKWAFCNTIKDDFIKNGRGEPNSKAQDMNWLKAKSEHLINEGIIITVNELYDYCKNKNMER